MITRRFRLRPAALRASALLAASTGLAACGHVDSYEAAVHDLDPRYCYQSLARVECYETPYPRYAEQLVNYQGPHPSRYPAPERPEAPELKAPAPVNYWVKDAEPVPRPAPVGYRQGSLPWLEQPVRPTPLPAEEQVSDISGPQNGASAATAGSVPLASPAPPGRKPALRAPAPGARVPLADPRQGYPLSGGGATPAS